MSVSLGPCSKDTSMPPTGRNEPPRRVPFLWDAAQWWRKDNGGVGSVAARIATMLHVQKSIDVMETLKSRYQLADLLDEH